MSENSDMTCAELADVAAELALGVLTGRERAMAVAHLDNCDSCREDVRQLMATGEQLLELVPPAEPPPGFETRVLERLGMPVPSPESGPPRRHKAPRLTGPAQGQTRPRGDRPRGGQHSGTRRPGRLRRALAATAVALAVIVAGVGGWRLGVSTAPTAAQPLTTASLVTPSHQDVGNIFLYSGDSPWLFMSVDMGSGNELVTCQLVGADGQVTTLGSFQLADGYGAWGSGGAGTVTPPHGARLVSATGTVLATATFTH